MKGTDMMKAEELLALADVIDGETNPTMYDMILSRWDRGLIMDALRLAAQADAQGRCARCGSSGDTYVLCSGCGAPTPPLSIEPQRAGVPDTRPDHVATVETLRTLAALFSESAHETWTREEIINIIEDAIRLGAGHVGCPADERGGA